MGDGLQQKRNEAQPARHRIEPSVDPRRAAPRATAILGLQRAAGNRAVAQLLAQVAKPPRGTIQRLRTADQWVTDTTTYSGLRKKKEKRSEGLKAIDARLLEYEAAYGRRDLDAAMAALNEVADLLGKWRIASEPNIRGTFSKEERAAAEAHGAKKVKNWQPVADMQKEVEAEIKLLQTQLNDRETAREEAKAEARAQQIDLLIPDALKASTDISAKALALFRIFMEEFRGSAVYATSSARDASIWDKSGPTACATNCFGLEALLKRAGLETQTVEFPHRYFVTYPLGESFIDPSAPGNVSLPGKTVEETNRYFFTIHYVVAVKGGPLLDPTSGVVTDAAGTGVVDPAYKGFAMKKGGDYENGEYELAVGVKDDRGGSRYAMSPLKRA